MTDKPLTTTAQTQDDCTLSLVEAVRALLSNMKGPYIMFGLEAKETIYKIDPRYVAQLRALVAEGAK